LTQFPQILYPILTSRREDYQILVRRILERDGVSRRNVAGTGRKGWAALGRTSAAVAILDINLPDYGWVQDLPKLRQDPA